MRSRLENRFLCSHPQDKTLGLVVVRFRSEITSLPTFLHLGTNSSLLRNPRLA